MNSKAGYDLERTGRCLFRTSGCSMEPLLHHHKSYAQIRYVDRPLRIGDVGLFERPDGSCVLHRVMKVWKHSYLFVGDNCDYVEEVPSEWVLGIMEGFYPDMDTPYVDCTEDPKYKQQTVYAYFHYYILRVKLFLRRVFARMKQRT